MLTPEQVAAYLQLNKDTAYRLIRDRKLAAVRVGRSYRVPQLYLETYIRTNSTGAQVRQAMFRRVDESRVRKPTLGGDALLEKLEREDEQLRSAGS